MLRQQGADAIGIGTRPINIHPQERIIIGDPRSNKILMEAGIKTAQTLVLANNDDALNLAILTQARSLNPKIRIVNRLLNSTLGESIFR
jgi:Trk K+ transport system NAD-binding subunit